MFLAMLENCFQYDLPEAGCDEAGRGCLAGPVFAAAVMLPPDMVIHRISGDGPKKLLIAPEWSGNKRAFLNTFSKALRESGCFQGQDFTN